MDSKTADREEMVGANEGRTENRERSAGDHVPKHGNWKTIIDTSIARSRKVRGGNYVQIATVSSDGMPHCRTVVFRGFAELPLGQSPQSAIAMKMITDARSEKVGQIKHSPRCEMVWWFAKTSEQFRISGNLVLVGDDTDENNNPALHSARKQQWGNLSGPAREQFFWPSPGLPLPLDQEASGEAREDQGEAEPVPKGGRGQDGKVLDAPSNFLLMLLVPDQVKYLRLTDNTAQLDTATADGGWESARVNP